MPPTANTGLLLVNLGTPASPRRGDVRRYLREFLFDPRVIDLPAWRRWLVLNLFILPFRPKSSGEAYAKIWTDRGSPLLFHSIDLAAKVQARLGDLATTARDRRSWSSRWSRRAHCTDRAGRQTT